MRGVVVLNKVSSHLDQRYLQICSVVMAGLVPAIHVFVAADKKDVDARLKAGHDENLET